MQSFRFAVMGMVASIHTQRNLRVHFVFALLALTAAFCFQISNTEWLVVLICIGAVISAELFNTAVEHLVNLVSPGQHPLAGKAKDAAAAAVLVLAVTAAVCGILIFGSHFLLWLK